MAISTQKLLLDIQVRNQRALGEVASNVDRIGRSSQLAGTAIKGFVAFLSVRQIVDFGRSIRDASAEFENLSNRLRLVTNGQDDLASTYDRLVDLAVANRTSVAETIELYSKLRITTQDLGASSEQVELITSRLSKALAISGADGNTAASVIRQFGQAMASGTVRGDEFRSIVEGLGPSLAIMAKQTGVNIGELRKLSQSGQLTATTFANMLIRSTELDEAFNKTLPTIDQLEMKTGDAFNRFLVQVGKATGLTDLYRESLESLGEWFDRAAGRYDPDRFFQLGKYKEGIDEIKRQLTILEGQIRDAQMFEDVGLERILIEKYDLLVEKLELATNTQRQFGEATKNTTKDLKEQDPAIKAINDAIAKMKERYSDTQITINAMNSTFDAFYNSASKNLTDVVFKVQTLDQALGNIVKDTLRAIVQGFIQMVIVGPAIRILIELFERLFNIQLDTASAVDKETNAQKRLNSELKKTIGLKLFMMLLGFAGGGKITGGNGGAIEGDGYANGGKLGFGGFRAIGGTAGSSNAYVVGERGPELFVPNTAGTVIPNNRMGSGAANITFNINATDASGFDQLLVQRRGLITNMISDALNRQGRRFT